ncbi:MAG: hypothetical protein ACXVDN_11645 [Ktedonobacteraceae bacterium]
MPAVFRAGDRKPPSPLHGSRGEARAENPWEAEAEGAQTTRAEESGSATA